MKKKLNLVKCLITIAMVGVLPMLIAKSKDEIVPLNQFSQLHEKLASGKPVTVVFLGGSITMGAKSGKGKSYRELVGAWLTQTYPKAKIKLVNRGIGSTGSILGAFRFEDQILNENPDLLFIEFCVNDSGSGLLALKTPHSEKSPYRSLSGLVRRARESNPDMAIVMPLTTMRKSTINERWKASRKVFTSFANMEHVPFVDLYEACYEKPLPAGLTEDLLFTGPNNPGNAVHPDNGGHKAYAHAINTALEKLFKTGEFSFSKVKKEQYQSFPVEPRLYTAKDFQGTESWIIKKASSRYPSINGRDVMIATAKSQPITLKFKGSPTILWGYAADEKNKSEGVIELYVDGKLLQKISGKSKLQGTKPLGRWNWIYKSMNPNQEHTLTIKVAKNQKNVFIPILGIGVDTGRP
ncbi:MAG: SGNH/GDSL hydrolase family protein [Lentisphaeraceae bacterium]|nr:SGNH/GDSL hydrolase family protein [Lentisphaeraceae bacterium]